MAVQQLSEWGEQWDTDLYNHNCRTLYHPRGDLTLRCLDPQGSNMCPRRNTRGGWVHGGSGGANPGPKIKVRLALRLGGYYVCSFEPSRRAGNESGLDQLDHWLFFVLFCGLLSHDLRLNEPG